MQVLRWDEGVLWRRRSGGIERRGLGRRAFYSQDGAVGGGFGQRGDEGAT
jgi:hypothetical protein